MKGGTAAVEASTDPLIALAKAIDPFAREARRRLEEGVDAVIDRNQQLVAQARFAVLGETVYPDATFTLRVSVRTVRGWAEAGREVTHFTKLGGLYQRVTGSPPFVLPSRWMERKSSVTLDTPFNLAADTDIIACGIPANRRIAFDVYPPSWAIYDGSYTWHQFSADGTLDIELKRHE